MTTKPAKPAADPAASSESDKTPPAAAIDFVRDRVVRAHPRLRVLILQHPQEQDALLGTAPLVTASLDRSVLRTGLSWASLAHALEEEEAEPSRWAVMYRGSLGRELTERETAMPVLLLDRKSQRKSPDELHLDGIVVLDGTWSQAKALWWRNPWLLKLNRLLLHPKEPSAYGKLRKQPSNQHVSTLEAIALALDGLGEEPTVGADLRRLFRTLCQRARDAGVTNSSGPGALEALAESTTPGGKARPARRPAKKRGPKRDDVAF
jgi:DTW domain-containing protein YfiP